MAQDSISAENSRYLDKLEQVAKKVAPDRSFDMKDITEMLDYMRGINDKNPDMVATHLRSAQETTPDDEDETLERFVHHPIENAYGSIRKSELLSGNRNPETIDEIRDLSESLEE